MNDQNPLTDPLTGLSSQWHFDVIFDFVFELGDRGVSMTLVLFEIDGLAAHVAEGGAAAKEAALGRFGRMLAEGSRKMDLTARHGDERFMCLLLACNMQGGMVFADRVRADAAGITAATGLTLSAGVAAYTGDMKQPADLETAVEKALETARRAGGDRVGIPRDSTE
ncbi:MAG: hypothetical protein BMS9Abin29_1729 [Gemmatimonadota bacterium]|nr:MAG: hypothetical protein BMS9Abin29_1729 [Gemmatimonadota bacterium]